eukprot:3708186-Amphidinium_carterae.1
MQTCLNQTDAHNTPVSGLAVLHVLEYRVLLRSSKANKLGAKIIALAVLALANNIAHPQYHLKEIILPLAPQPQEFVPQTWVEE